MPGAAGNGQTRIVLRDLTKIYGDQRGAALSDFDGDARIDLAVAQNGATTKLYRNTGAKPGLRVKLSGHEDNPQAVGSLVRLNFADSQSPTRSISSGSGYWSQQSAIQVFGLPSWPQSVTVHWPNGKSETYPIPADKIGSTNLTVTQDGDLAFH